MKNFRRLCFAVVLATVFTVPVLADGGETQGPPAPGDTQGPSITGETQGPSITGEVQTPGVSGVTHGPGFTTLGDIGSPGLSALIFAIQRMLA